MPQRIICSNCGHVLHEEEDLRPPEEIVHMFDDERCPVCGHKLSYIPKDVVISPFGRVRRGRTRR